MNGRVVHPGCLAQAARKRPPPRQATKNRLFFFVLQIGFSRNFKSLLRFDSERIRYIGVGEPHPVN